MRPPAHPPAPVHSFVCPSRPQDVAASNIVPHDKSGKQAPAKKGEILQEAAGDDKDQ
jgi:hypothetical protein